MNAVRTPSIVLLFHSYMFQDLLSLSLYPRSIPREISSRSTRRVGRLAFFATRISPTLSRLRSTADEGEKILRGFIPHAARERSRTFDDHFLFINRASLVDPARRIPRIVSLRHGRYSPETFVPRETLEKEKGVLVNRTFRRFVSRSRITKFSRAVEAWKQAARRIVVLGDFTKPDNGAI